MMRSALVIGCGDSDLHARITSNRSEGGILIYRGWRLIIWPIVTVVDRGQDNGDGKNSSYYNAAISTMTWEHDD